MAEVTGGNVRLTTPTCRTLVSVAYTDLPSDGRVLRAATAAVDAGADVTVVVPQSSQMEPNQWPFRTVTLPVNHQRGQTTVAGHWRFMRALDQWARNQRPPDVVHIHNMPDYLFWCVRRWQPAGSRVVLDVHDIMSILVGHKVARGFRGVGVVMLRLLERWVWQRVDHIITVHDQYRAIISRAGVSPSRISVVLNTCSLDHCSPERRRAPSPGRFKIVWHGTVSERTGVRRIVHAFDTICQAIPEATLLLVGEGNASHLVHHDIAAAEARSEIRFVDRYVPLPEVMDMIADADVGVVPNLPSEYTKTMLPVKLLEYATLGIPIVATRLPVVEYYMGQDTIAFVDDPTPQALATQVVQLSQDPQRRITMALKAQRAVANHAWDRYRTVLLSALDLGPRWDISSPVQS